jgi:lipopolysaccharide export system protein LptA
MRKTLPGIALIFAAGILAAGAAAAQIAAGKGPIDISADHQFADNNKHMTTYKGRVEALQGQNRLRSDQLDIYFKEADQGSKPANDSSATGSFGDIDHLEALGNVYFVTPTEVIRGDRAVYTQASDTIEVTGNVVATQGENVERGSRLIVHVNAKTSEMIGQQGSGRVRTVVYPNKTQNSGH